VNHIPFSICHILGSMGSVPAAVMGVLMRWLHIISAVTLLGGMIYARYVMAPAATVLPESERQKFAVAARERMRPLVLVPVFTLVISGVYNLAGKSNIPPNYFLWFGLKMLLALHVIAVSFLLVRASLSQERSNRLLTGVVYSGMAVALVSAYLRLLSNWLQS
jgi:uncharacterized membrane protein